MKISSVSLYVLVPFLVFFATMHAQTPTANAASDLGGTSWRLVKFQSGNGTTLTPEDKAKYTIEFANDRRVSVRIDCNRGRGTWPHTRRSPSGPAGAFTDAPRHSEGART